MVSSKAKAVSEYLSDLTPEHRELVGAVRTEILANLPDGYQETMQYGMISYVVPLERYPDTYNRQPLGIISLASQKNYCSLYLMCVYSHASISRWFEDEWKATGKKLNMGKSCVRFKRLDDLPLELVGRVVAKVPVDDFIRIYEEARRK